jgi:hypothetical protein
MEAAGASYGAMVLTVATMFIGLFVIVALAKKGIKGAVLFGMLISSVVYWAGSFLFLNTNPFAALATASFLPPVKDMAETTLFKLNFQGFMEIGWFTVITLVVTFCIIDMFDTIGTLVGTASRAGMVDEKGNMPKMKEALLSDAIATMAGACTGTSTVTTFVESASGVEAGGRTGLTALTCGILFLACIFIAPIAAIIPPAATSAALIYVGVLMLQGLKSGLYRHGPDGSRMPDADCHAGLRFHRPRHRSGPHCLHHHQDLQRQVQGCVHSDLHHFRTVLGEVLPGCIRCKKLPPGFPRRLLLLGRASAKGRHAISI